MEMSSTHISITEAARQSGLHPNSLRRLLRLGEIAGYKSSVEGKSRWMVAVSSLKRYTDPVDGVLLDRPGPKKFLKRTRQ